MVDTADLKSAGLTAHTGSSPVSSMEQFFLDHDTDFVLAIDLIKQVAEKYPDGWFLSRQKTKFWKYYGPMGDKQTHTLQYCVKNAWFFDGEGNYATFATILHYIKDGDLEGNSRCFFAYKYTLLKKAMHWRKDMTPRTELIRFKMFELLNFLPYDRWP